MASMPAHESQEEETTDDARNYAKKVALKSMASYRKNINIDM